MKTICFKLQPKTDFAGPIKGDTLFAKICCQIAELLGEEFLECLLADYKEGHPFLVVSDLFPDGYLPRATLPMECFGIMPSSGERKQFKQKQWIKVEDITKPVQKWHAYLTNVAFQKIDTRIHNAVNPKTGTVDGAKSDGKIYAPYAQKVIHYQMPLNVYMVYDETRISEEEIEQMLKNIGKEGIGRSATRGLGKFEVSEQYPVSFVNKPTHYYMTLAPSVPHQENVNASESYYKLFTRFGKQTTSQNGVLPFKNPVLMADTGAVFCFNGSKKDFMGCGLGKLSQDKKIVCQGYAPIIPLTWEVIAQKEEK